MPYLRVGIIGSGTKSNPYRPAIAGSVSRWSAHIPSNADGTPRFATCVVWVPDSIPIPPAFQSAILDRRAAQDDVRRDDPRANPDVMEDTR